MRRLLPAIILLLLANGDAAIGQYRDAEPFMVALDVPNDSVSISNDVQVRVLLIGGVPTRSVFKLPALTRDVALIVRDSSGQRVRPLEPTPTSPPLLVADDKNAFIQLSNGAIFGLEEDIPANRLVPGPGKYTIVALYRSNAFGEQKNVPDAITCGDGIFKSEPVELVVTP